MEEHTVYMCMAASASGSFLCYPGTKGALRYQWLRFETTETFISRDTEVEYTRSALRIYDVLSMQ